MPWGAPGFGGAVLWVNDPSTPLDAEELNLSENEEAAYAAQVGQSVVDYFEASFPRVNPVHKYSADPTGARDATSAFASAYADGAVDIPPGTYLINGLLDISGLKDFLGTGTGNVVFKLGAGGQIRMGHGGGSAGGRIGGFEIDGQGVQNVAGGGFYIVGRNYVNYEDIWVHGCVGSDCVIEAVQNIDFFGFRCGGTTDPNPDVSLILDNGCGGIRFFGGEIRGYRTQQTKVSTGGYPTWLGPSDIHFYGTIVEWQATGLSHPMVYYAAGTDHSYENSGISGSNGQSILRMEPGAQNYPAITANITAWDGADHITVDNVVGVTGLMSAAVPNTPPETITFNVTGNVVQLSFIPTATPVGGVAKFGADCSRLQLHEVALNGDQTSGTTAIEQRGSTSIYISGHFKVNSHGTAYKQRASDKIYLATPPDYLSVTTTEPQQQAGDTGAWASDLQVIPLFDGTLRTLTRWGAHRALMLGRSSDGNPHTVVTPGQIAFSDGMSYPQNVGLSYVKDGDGTEHAFAFGQSLRTQFRSTVVGDGATFIQGSFRGMLNGVGPPSTNNGKVGDWCIDTRGGAFVLVASGTPDTWINPSTVRPLETITIDPVLAGMDAALQTGTWVPSPDAAAIGGGWLYNSSNAQNDEIGWSVDLTQGTWTLALMYRQLGSQAIATVNRDGTSIGTIDQYAAAQTNNVTTAITGFAVARSGSHTISFKAATRNASATGWFLVIQKIQLRRTA